MAENIKCKRLSTAINTVQRITESETFKVHLIIIPFVLYNEYVFTPFYR